MSKLYCCSGTMRSILKQAAMEIEELQENLK